MRRLGWRALQPLNAVLGAIERRVPVRAERFPLPPVFIIGAPRSGSTLLYQILLAAWRFGYLSNLHCRLYGSPLLAQSLAGRWVRRWRPGALDSHDGQTRGLLAPSECGRFWYRWFPYRPQYVRDGDVSADRLRSLREVLLRLTERWGRPLLFKNLTCAMRLRVLGRLLPEALFVVIRRDPVWIAQSLLAGRARVLGSEAAWWSTQPPNVDALRGLPPEIQVVEQVASIYRTIEADAAVVGPERFHAVAYESLCSDPAGVLAGVRAFGAARGLVLPLPDPLPILGLAVRRTKQVSDESFHRIESHAQRVFGRGAPSRETRQ